MQTTGFNLFLKSAFWFKQDARHFQIIFLTFFLGFGLLFLKFDFPLLNPVAIFAGCIGTQLVFNYWYKLPLWSVKSSLISVLGMSILLKSQHPELLFLAGVLAISSKFLIKYKGKHVFNPGNAGIVLTGFLTGGTWVTLGQWGSELIFFLFFSLGGILTVSRAGRLDTAFAFIITFALLEAGYNCLWLGWPLDFLWHKLSNGALLLFTFFMITDPRTTPNHKTVRMVWAGLIAVAAFYLINFKYYPNAFIPTLFVLSPLTPLLDKWFRAETFQWKPLKLNNMKMMKPMILLVVSAMTPFFSNAFCGFYVDKAGSGLFNQKSEVILVRDGKKTTLTMSNDFKGEAKDFAMVVPVPEILRERDIKIVNRNIFDVLDGYSSPRLVEYYDHNPCFNGYYRDRMYEIPSSVMEESDNVRSGAKDKNAYNVTIEAKYQIGEYDILILSAKESGGLKAWLTDNGYKIPESAHEVLDPYIKDNLKFFVVKVNLEKHAKSNFSYLSPIQITYESDRFMLPIRLGMANASGPQDLIIYAFTKKGRIETANYRTVKMTSNLDVPTFVLKEFGHFYVKTFDKHYKSEGRNAVFLEYAWNVTPDYGGMKCDPCVGPPPVFGDMMKAGVDWLGDGNNTNVFFTRLHVRYTRDKFPQDLVFTETPNRENFQARYVIRHPAHGDLSCEEGIKYKQVLASRQKSEIRNYAQLTGTKTGDYLWYIDGDGNSSINKEEKKKGWFFFTDNNKPMFKWLFLFIPMVFIFISLLMFRIKNPLEI